MKEIILKKGYTIKVTSHEGDGDNYNTLYHHTTDKKEIGMLVELLELTVDWGYESKPEDWKQELLDFGEQHKWFFKKTRQELWDNELEDVQDILEELVGRYSHNWNEFREQDDYTVYYTDEDVYSEIYLTSRTTI